MAEYKNRSRPQARRMTRAHFEAIAEALLRTRAQFNSVADYVAVVQQFADMCAASNPAFDRSRFERACGLETETPRGYTREAWDYECRTRTGQD